MNPSARALALGGLVGPVAFVGAWTVAGLRTRGYSPGSDAISDLAAIGASTRTLMTAGFVVDGIGLTAFGLSMRTAVDGRAWIAAGAISAAALLASTAGPAHGFWQRLGLTVGDAWIVAIAALILAGRLPGAARTD